MKTQVPQSISTPHAKAELVDRDAVLEVSNRNESVTFSGHVEAGEIQIEVRHNERVLLSEPASGLEKTCEAMNALKNLRNHSLLMKFFEQFADNQHATALFRYLKS